MKDNLNKELLKKELSRIDDYKRVFYNHQSINILFNCNNSNKEKKANEKIDNHLFENSHKEEILKNIFNEVNYINKEDAFKKTLIKVTLLNSFYGTAINNIDLVNVTKRIIDNKIDDIFKELKEKNVDLEKNIYEAVHRIAYNESSIIKCSETKIDNNLYSFATKYCAWHYPDFFPIADSYSKGMLYYLNEEIGFYKKDNGKKPTQKEYNEYDIYRNIYLKFIDTFNLDLNLKDIDIFFWLYGKKHNIKVTETARKNTK